MTRAGHHLPCMVVGVLFALSGCTPPPPTADDLLRAHDDQPVILLIGDRGWTAWVERGPGGRPVFGAQDGQGNLRFRGLTADQVRAKDESLYRQIEAAIEAAPRLERRRRQMEKKSQGGW